MRLGEYLEIWVGIALGLLALGACIAGIVLAVNLSQGAPFKCGPEGVQAVFPSTGLNHEETVEVCKNGRIGRSSP